MAKILIKNAIIIDGAKTPRFTGNLAVNNDRIVKISTKPLDEKDFDTVIDARGKILCPGFIDAHSHSDLKLLVNPFVDPKIRQGITTDMLAQDGLSLAPLPLEYVSPWRKNIAGLDGDSDDIGWDWITTENYLQRLEKNQVGLNVCYLVPHGNVRMEAMGLEARAATKEEIQKMTEITEREMKSGCYALSTGLIYFPHAYSTTEEVTEICKVAAKYDVPLVVHQRSEADTILDSMEELLTIARGSGVKMHISHFKICGKKNWDKIDGVLSLLDQFQKENIPISLDMYPYVTGSTMLGVILPPWVHAGGTDKLLERLKDPEAREKMKQDITHGIHGWDNFIDFAGFEGIFVTSVETEKNKDCVGKSLEEIAKMRGKDPFDATFDLLLEEKNSVGMYDHYGKEEHLARFMKREECTICTDGLLGGRPHPRTYGAFPRVLKKFVREEKILTLEEAIYKMTHKTATVFRIAERGLLKEGHFADLVIFDPETVGDNATFLDPDVYPTGIEYVIVNGEIALAHGEQQPGYHGKVLRLQFDK